MKKYILICLWVLGGLALYGCNQKTGPICNDNESLIDGKCVINRTDFENKLYNTAQLANVSVEWVVTLGEETSTSILKFDGSKSSVQAGNHTEYFETVGSNLYRYYPTTSGYQRETIESNTNTPIQFFDVLKESDFTLLDSRYLLNYGTYPSIEAFVQSYDDEATYANFELAVDTFITQIKLDIIVGDLVYKLTLNYYDYNQTTVEVPTYVS